MSNRDRLIEEWRFQQRFHPYEHRPADHQFLEDAHHMDPSERYYRWHERPSFHRPEQRRHGFHHPNQHHLRFHPPEQYHPHFHHSDQQHQRIHQGFIPAHQQRLHEECRDLTLERQHVFEDLHRLEQRVQTLRMSDQTVNHQNFIQGQRLNFVADRPESHPPRVLNGQSHPAGGNVLIRATQITTRIRPLMGPLPLLQQYAPRQLVRPLQINSFPESPRTDLKDKSNVVDTGTSDSKVVSQVKTNIVESDESPKNIPRSSSSLADSQNGLKQEVELEIDKSIPPSTVPNSSATLKFSKMLDCTPDENITVAKERTPQTLQSATKQATSKDFLDQGNRLSVKSNEQIRSSAQETKESKQTKPVSDDTKSLPQLENLVIPCLAERISLQTKAKPNTNINIAKDKESMVGKSPNQQSQHNKPKQIPEISKSNIESLHQNSKVRAESQGISKHSSAQEALVVVPSDLPNKISDTTIIKQIPISTKSGDVKKVESPVSKSFLLDRNFEPIKSVVSSRSPTKSRSSERKTTNLKSCESYGGKDVKDTMSSSMKVNRESTNIICITAVDSNKNNKESIKGAQEQGSSTPFSPPMQIQVITSRFKNPSSISKTRERDGKTNLSITSNISSSNQMAITSLPSYPSAASPIKPARKIEESFGFETNASSVIDSIKAQPTKESCHSYTKDSISPKFLDSVKFQSQSVPQPTKLLKDILLDIGLDVKPFESKQEQRNETESISADLSNSNENEEGGKADEKKTKDPGKITKVPNFDAVKKTQISMLELKSIIEKVQDIKVVDGHKGLHSKMTNDDCHTTKGPNSGGENSAITNTIPINEIKTIMKMAKEVEKPEHKSKGYEDYDARNYGREAYEQNSIAIKLPQRTEKTIDDLISGSDDEGEMEEDDTFSRRSRSKSKNSPDAQNLSGRYNSKSNRSSSGDKSPRKSLSSKERYPKSYNSQSQYDLSSERSMEDRPEDGTTITSSYSAYVSPRKNRHYQTDSMRPSIRNSDDNMHSRWTSWKKTELEKKDLDERKFSRWNDLSRRSHARKNLSERKDLDERSLSRKDSSEKSHSRKVSSEKKGSDERKFSRWNDSSEKSLSRKYSSEKSHSRKDSSEKKDSDERRLTKCDDSSENSHTRKDSNEKKDSDERRFSRWNDSREKCHSRKDSWEKQDSDDKRFSRWNDASENSHSRKDSSEKSHSRKDSSENSHSRKDSSENKDSDERRFSRWDDSGDRNLSLMDSSANKNSDERRYSSLDDNDYRRSPIRDNCRSSIYTNYDYRSGQFYDSTKTYSTLAGRHKESYSTPSPMKHYSIRSQTKSTSARSLTKSSSAKSPTKSSSTRSPTKSSSAKSPTRSSSARSRARSSSARSPEKPSSSRSLMMSSLASNPKKSKSNSSPTKGPFSFSKHSPYKKGLSSRRNLYENELNKDCRKHQPPTTIVPSRREVVTYGDMDQYRKDPDVDSEALRNTFNDATKHTNFDWYSTGSSVEEGEIKDVGFRNGSEKKKRTLEIISITPPTVASIESFTADRDYRKSPEIVSKVSNTKNSGKYSPITCDSIRDQRSYEPSRPSLYELTMKDVDYKTVFCKSKGNMISPESSSVPNKGINILQEPRNETEQRISSRFADTTKISKDGQEIKSKPEIFPSTVGLELSQKKTSVDDESCVTIENSLSKISLKITEGFSVPSIKETGTSTQKILQPEVDLNLKSQNRIARKSRWDIKVGSMKPTAKREEMFRKDQLKKAVSAMAVDPSIIENLVEYVSDQSTPPMEERFSNIVEEAVKIDPEAHPTKTVVEANAISTEVHPAETVAKIAPDAYTTNIVIETSSNIVFEDYSTDRAAEAEKNFASASSREPEFHDFNPASDPYIDEVSEHCDATIKGIAGGTKPTKTTNNTIELTYSNPQGCKSSQPIATSCSEKATNNITGPTLCSTSDSDTGKDKKEPKKEKHDQKKYFASKVINNSKQRHSSENSKKKYSSKLSSGVDNEMFSKYKCTKSGVPKPPISSSGISDDSSKSFKAKRRHKSSVQLRVQSESFNILSSINPIVIDSSSSSETEGKSFQAVTPQVQSVQKDEVVIYVSSSESDVQCTMSPLKIQGKKKVNTTSVAKLDARGTSSVSKNHEEVNIDKELVILVKDIYPNKTKDARISKMPENDAEKNQTKDLATNPDQPKNQHKLKLKIPKKTGTLQCKEDLSGDNSSFGSFLEQQSHEYLKKRIKSNKSPKRFSVKPLSLPSTPDKNVMEYPTVKHLADRSLSCDDSKHFKTPDKPKLSSDSLLLRESTLSGFKKNLEKSPILKAKLKSSSPGNQKSQAGYWNSGESSKIMKEGLSAVRSSIEEPINDDIVQSNNAVEAVMKPSIESAQLKSAVSKHGKTNEIDDDSGVTPLPDDHSNSDDSEVLGSPAGSLDLGEDDDIDLEKEISLLGYNDDIPSKMSSATSSIEVMEENMDMSISLASSSTTETIPKSSNIQQSSKHSNTGFSLDDLLAEKDTEVRNRDLLQMQDELKEDIKKGGFKVLQEEALADSCNDLLPEQERELEKLQVSDSVISELHPGEKVFHSELFLRVFNELMKPSHCGFTPGGSLIDQQLSNVQSDLLADFL
ncbi:hypothetical protein LOTGIDRAFT_237228, partial [Lottia gigantea]